MVYRATDKICQGCNQNFFSVVSKLCPVNSGLNQKPTQNATTQQPQISISPRKINKKMIILYYHLNHKDKEVIHFFRSISAPFSSFRIA